MHRKRIFLPDITNILGLIRYMIKIVLIPHKLREPSFCIFHFEQENTLSGSRNNFRFCSLSP
jgi:hypothetical protein